MSEVKFTPGPWKVIKVSGSGNCAFDIYTDNYDVVSSSLMQVIRKEEDAHLIAAAPDLYAACEEFVRKVDAGEARSTRSYAAMKAALAKARGETE